MSADWQSLAEEVMSEWSDIYHEDGHADPENPEEGEVVLTAAQWDDVRARLADALEGAAEVVESEVRAEHEED